MNLTIQRIEREMSEAQHKNWLLRKQFSWVIIGVAVVAVISLGWSLQGAQRRYEAQCAKAALWQNIIDHIPTAIVATNDAGEIIAWNNGATVLFGWEEDEVMGSTTDFLMPSNELREQHHELWANSDLKQELFEGKILELTTDAAHKDGTMVCVKSKVAGAQNASKSFVLLFYPNRRIMDQGVYVADVIDPIKPAPHRHGPNTSPHQHEHEH
jgi:PAS domain S-box-containing protein